MKVDKLAPLLAKLPVAVPSQSVIHPLSLRSRMSSRPSPLKSAMLLIFQSAVALDVAGADDLPVEREEQRRIRAVVGEVAGGSTEPLREPAIVPPQQDVAVAVAVEIAGARDLPVGREEQRDGGVIFEEAAPRGPKPAGEPAVRAPHKIVGRTVAIVHTRRTQGPRPDLITLRPSR